MVNISTIVVGSIQHIETTVEVSSEEEQETTSQVPKLGGACVMSVWVWSRSHTPFTLEYGNEIDSLCMCNWYSIHMRVWNDTSNEDSV